MSTVKNGLIELSGTASKYSISLFVSLPALAGVWVRGQAHDPFWHACGVLQSSPFLLMRIAGFARMIDRSHIVVTKITPMTFQTTENKFPCRNANTMLMMMTKPPMMAKAVILSAFPSPREAGSGLGSVFSYGGGRHGRSRGMNRRTCWRYSR
jgi:hypothetical protein